MEIVELSYDGIEENEEYRNLIQKVITKCFETENLLNKKIYINIILTIPENIRKINKQFRNIDKETDVLSFPMFEKQEIDNIVKKGSENQDILGDIMISIPKVENQAIEYNHSFERELAYMVVHGFYHLMGYDHMNDEEKEIMRKKEENVLNNLNINRE